jgi:C-terminal processing protease CtpA/Prc
MVAELEVESLIRALPDLELDELDLPVEADVLDNSGLGYIRVTSFSGDYNLTARLWEAHLEALLENEVAGLILDLRFNGGGSSGLSQDFAGYFHDQEVVLYQRAYYSENTGEFELRGVPSRVEPGPLHFDNPVVVLIGPNCISACEGFVHALSQLENTLLIGHYPTAGAFGEVGRGQYELPGEISMQFPTGRPVGPEGEVLIEGVGVQPDILVPVTAASALGAEDTLLEAGVEVLLDEIQ